MAQETIVARLKDSKDKKKIVRETKATFDFGSNLEEAIKKWGKEAVFAHFVANARIDVQALMRSKMALQGKDKLTDAAIATVVKAHKLTAGRAPADPKKLAAATDRNYERLPQAERERLIKKWIAEQK